MFLTPYQTTPCSRYDLSKTFSGIRRLEIDSALVTAQGAPGVKLVPAGVDTFQPYGQPITKLDSPNLESSVVIDGRSLLRADRTPVKLDVYNHAVLYGHLVEMWYTQQNKGIAADLLNLGNFPAKIFINWISGPMVRLGLEFGQMQQFRILAAVYYIQLFNPLPEHPTADDRERLLTRATRLIPGFDMVTIEQFLGEVPRLNNIRDFVKWVIEKLDTERLHNLIVDYFYSALGFNFGPQYREAVAVALEYPPAFMAMVYTACKERTYQKSGLGKIIEKLISRGDDKEFIKNMNHLTGMK
jgi:hypothetical protein